MNPAMSNVEVARLIEQARIEKIAYIEADAIRVINDHLKNHVKGVLHAIPILTAFRTEVADRVSELLEPHHMICEVENEAYVIYEVESSEDEQE